MIAVCVQACTGKWEEMVPNRTADAAKQRWHLLRCSIPDSRNMEMHQQV